MKNILNRGRKCLDAHCLDHAAPCTESVALCHRPVATESWDKHLVATRYGNPRGDGEAPCGLRWGQCHLPAARQPAHPSGVFDEKLIWARGGQRGCVNFFGHPHDRTRVLVHPWLVSKKTCRPAEVSRPPGARRAFPTTRASAVLSSNAGYAPLSRYVQP